MKKVQRTKKGRKIGMQEFHDMLILARWARSFFQGSNFGSLQRALNREELEGINSETGQTRFFHELMDATLFNLNKVDRETFSRYDGNIVRHWRKITERRSNEEGRRMEMKYFQYLTFLVTELYLDRYFNQRESLLEELNQEAQKYNEEHPENMLTFTQTEGGQASVFSMDSLRKIAYWEATGAGKTLMLQVNLLQYLEYAEKAHALPDRIILLTPNEGLAKQHIREMHRSGLRAEWMSESELFKAQGTETVYVVDSGKLISDNSTKKKGEKSFYAQSFEGKNLVLVDEGHHGSSNEDGEHRRTRELLCKDGFSFEYSATFGQAVAGEQASQMKEEYAKSILFDYSYRYFYEDGYGKESFILNLPDDGDEDQLFCYLCANLLAYYQQHYLYAKSPQAMAHFLIAKPLCIFVGNKVNAEAADVPRVISFYADVMHRKEEVIKIIRDLVADEGILKTKKSDPLKGRYVPLQKLMVKSPQGPEAIYQDMLRKVFNAEYPASLKLCLEKASGEITMSVGEAPPFGLIMVGDPEQLLKRLEASSGEQEKKYHIQKRDFGKEYFADIDNDDSTISLLVGSRKFSEGWSSWRVSAMGLLNMGVREGTQIIQLFGRGVRLRGRGFSLKRSKASERDEYARNAFLESLETLQIFGVRADYMAQFRKYLENEGVHTMDQVLTLEFPIRKNEFPKGLMVPQVKNGYRLNQEKGFKSQHVNLFVLQDKIKRIEVSYDDFAYVQKLKSNGGPEETKTVGRDVKIDDRALDFFDWDGIYRELVQEKAKRGYWNLSISKERLKEFAYKGKSWYKLMTREEDVTFDSFAKLAKIEYLFRKLILAYMEQFYKRLQSLYEDEHREMIPLNENWIPDKYVFEIENTDTGRQWEENLKKLRQDVINGNIPCAGPNQWENGGFVVIIIKQHLYSPLFYNTDGSKLPFTYKPLSLEAESEKRFVTDLKNFYDSPDGESYFKDIDFYLMRNAANRLKGIGFAQAGNFYPDFLMWIIDKKTQQQYLTFIDPKGLRNIPFDSPKLNFAKEIKNLQESINQDRTDRIILNSVILSSTRQDDELLSQRTTEEYTAKNILFLDEGGSHYIPKLLEMAKRA